MRYSRDYHLWCFRFVASITVLCVFYSNIALSENVWNPQLYVMNIDGSGLQQLTHKPDWCYGSPQWSPDGKKIAADGWSLKEFKSSSYSATRLFVMDPDGENYKDIGFGAMPDWSSDGRQLVVHTYGQQASITVMNADGTGRERIANHWGSPRWFSKSSRIISLYGDNSKLAILDLATGEESIVRLPGGHFVSLGFNLSPDGTQISFADPGMGGLTVVRIDARNICNVIKRYSQKLLCGHSSWSPDGTKIVFSAQVNRDAAAQIYVADLKSDEPPQLLPGQPDSACSPDWSPDGKRIVFVADIED